MIRGACFSASGGYCENFECRAARSGSRQALRKRARHKSRFGVINLDIGRRRIPMMGGIWLNGSSIIATSPFLAPMPSS
jgi:hypothetical protein